jgi:proteasome accessory factor B
VCSSDLAKELPARLESLWDAINAKKSVDLDYFSPRGRTVTSRRVDPYGLALRRGVWNLVGWCHLRQGLRTFHVHRIRALRVNPARPKQADFTVPADFRVDDFVASWPWEHRFHEPVSVRVALSGELRPLAHQLFGVTPTEDGERAFVELAATNLDGLVTWVLSLGADARIVSPEQASTRLRELAAKVLTAHGGAA